METFDKKHLELEELISKGYRKYEKSISERPYVYYEDMVEFMKNKGYAIEDATEIVRLGNPKKMGVLGLLGFKTREKHYVGRVRYSPEMRKPNILWLNFRNSDQLQEFEEMAKDLSSKFGIVVKVGTWVDSQLYQKEIKHNE